MRAVALSVKRGVPLSNGTLLRLWRRQPQCKSRTALAPPPTRARHGRRLRGGPRPGHCAVAGRCPPAARPSRPSAPYPLLARADDEKDDVDVRLEDQQHINTFGRMNGRLHDVEDEIKAKQSQYELLDDASNEIILADDDEPIRYMFGECYFELTKDQADETLESQKAAVEEEIGTLKQELASIQDTLADLKSKLYGRFGKNINLEE